MGATSRLGDEIARGRRLTDELFARVRAEAIFDRPIPERHRILFYIGHVEAFDWNQVGRAGLGLDPVSTSLDQLFAFGIDPPPGELPSDSPEDWPSPDETRGYVRRVRARMDEVVDQAPEESLHIALEHRLMHAETFTYILHNLAYDRRVLCPDPAPVGRAEPAAPRMAAIPDGVAHLGRARGSGFGWDNEFGPYSERVPAFGIGVHKVTNAEYLAFVEDGGAAPHYWCKEDGGWCLRGTNARFPLPPDWPVYASYEQATAFAQWVGKKLPTEAQWHRAAFGTPDDSPRRYPWGDEAPTAAHGNFDFLHADPVPVTATPAGDSAFGVSQLLGNGWEWTRSVFAPFPGFEPFPSYPGYSANFFDGDHYVLKGASPATDRVLLRPTFRNWFRDHYPYAYTTFRVVEE